MNQTEQIHNYLKEGNSITAIEALNLFKCFRLAARISDLKRQGVNISSEMITTYTNKRVMRYSLSISEKKPLFCKPNRANNDNEPQNCKCGKKPIVALNSEISGSHSKIYIKCATNTCDAYQGLGKIGGITAIDKISLIKSWNKQDFTNLKQIKRTPEHGC